VGKFSPHPSSALNHPILSDRVSFQVYPSPPRSCYPCNLYAPPRFNLSTLLRCALAESVHHGYYFILSYHISPLLCHPVSPSCYLSPPPSLMPVSCVCESLDPSRLVSDCIDIDVRLSRRCCHHPCFANPSSLPSCLPSAHTCVSSLCFRCAPCFVYCRSSLIPCEPFGRILLFSVSSFVLFAGPLISLRTILLPTLTSLRLILR